MTPSKSIGSLCALLATLIWSGNFIIARGLGDVLPPITLAALRWSTATLVLLPFAAPIIWRERKLILTHWQHLLFSAVLGITVFNTFIYKAGHTTEALNLSLIATTTPIFVVLLSRIFLGEAITRFRALGLVISITGIVILVTRGQFQVLRDLSFHEGDIWMLGAGFLWAVYSIMLKKKPQKINPYAYLGTTFSIGTLPLIAGALIEQSIAPQFDLTPTVIGSVLYIGIGASLVSYVLWTKAVSIIGPSSASFIYYTLPAFCAVEAYFILNESATWAHGAGFLLIVSGIMLATHPKFNQ
ncbi:DMT family transporter [uncultured Pseudodesulfovibrio sp.]|uniref:DMT family transporter n=1 Tax=uncultured Pseudodesulfovibrio sp. TaxID=2035858 RepID=UPI0029C6AEEA|nr:DMT family transporter [uncultured Pseudodesulfovibrio sp.]